MSLKLKGCSNVTTLDDTCRSEGRGVIHICGDMIYTHEQRKTKKIQLKQYLMIVSTPLNRFQNTKRTKFLEKGVAQICYVDIRM